MNDAQTHIVDDLAGLLEGDLRCDPLTVSMYSNDGSLYQIPPLGVVFPRRRDDVITVVKYCSEMHIPMIARGAGTGIAGESLGRGLIIDFSRHMRRVEEIGDETVRVQPGLVCDRLNAILRPFGRYFPPDPSGSAVTTIGGMIGVDAAGAHSVRVGSTRDHVQDLEIVLAGGQVIRVEQEALEQLSRPPVPWPPEGPLATDSSPQTDPNIKRTLISKLSQILREHAPLIAERQPPMIRNRCGYTLRGILSDTHLNLPRLLVGSEGTLGLITAATLHTLPIPPQRGVALLLFGELEAATKAVQVIAQHEPSACDLLDRRLLSLARESDPRFEQMVAPNAEAALIVEMIGHTQQQVRERFRHMNDEVREKGGRPIVAFEGTSFDEVELLWALPKRVVPLLSRLQGPTRPLPFVEDIAVPPAVLHEFLTRAQNVFQKHQVTATLYAHAAAGQLHMRPFMVPPRGEEAQRIEELARDLYQVVFAVGGTISGEHGAGLSRTAFIRSQYGPLYRVFREIKEVFDPHNLLNPGKIISDDPHLTIRDLRPPTIPPPELVDLQLNWTPEALANAADRCNGCGTCRTQSASVRMCPLFAIEPLEEATPRAKANLMRHFAAGQLRTDDFTSPEMRRIANLCFNCKQCQHECPSNVNIPQLMIEAKAAYVAAHGLSRADWILSRAHSFGALGSMFPRVSNLIVGSTVGRWVLEKLTGISRQRKLPRFAIRTFLRSVDRKLLARPDPGQKPDVVLFVDYYANHHDPEMAHAFVAILRHHKISVHVPPGQVASGMALLSAGDLDAARKQALKNIRELADYAREKIPIICVEPSAALCLKQEYPMLVDHPDVGAIAEQTIEAGAYLQKLHREGKLRTDLGPLSLDVGYHTPCHLRALGKDTPLVELLGLIPQIRLHTIDKGCSGMAGAYGLTTENFRNSLRIGWGLISRMRQGDLSIGATECSTCKMQMEQGTPTPTLHPLKLLALSYGLMPEIETKLRPSQQNLVVT
ncbi:MAG TPA: anaerobic glycerol-3-phosphate dehydrogenase subunit C [Planctomycetaceae bacterium]|nr:anaerobic glycerol-3-phosphate dehydrogenase subunit C [Planctomycetaceae bacterium]